MEKRTQSTSNAQCRTSPFSFFFTYFVMFVPYLVLYAYGTIPEYSTFHSCLHTAAAVGAIPRASNVVDSSFSSELSV